MRQFPDPPIKIMQVGFLMAFPVLVSVESGVLSQPLSLPEEGSTISLLVDGDDLPFAVTGLPVVDHAVFSVLVVVFLEFALRLFNAEH